MESTFVVVLILNGLRKGRYYKVVTRWEGGFWWDMRDRAAEAHDLREHGQVLCSTELSQYSILVLVVKYKL